MNTDGADGPSPPGLPRLALRQISESIKTRSGGSCSAADRKSKGSSQRSSLSAASAGMKTYREQAGAKMAAIATVAREEMAKHQAEATELLHYLVYLILFLLIVFLRAPQDLPLYWNQALRARFTPSWTDLDDVRMSHTSFENVTSKEAFWLYMSNVLAPVLEPDNPPNFYMRNTLLGGIQLRQVRSEPQLCPYSVLVKDANASCFETSSWTVSKASYGGAEGDFFTWSSQTQADINRFLLAPDSTYGTGGFVAYLSTVANDTRATLLNLRSNGWMDDHTRALFVDFTLQNPTEYWLCVVRLMFDLPPYGGVRSSSFFRVADVMLYDSTSDQVVSVFEALFIVLYLRSGIVTCKEIRKNFVVFFSTIWGLIDFINMLLFAIIIIMTVVFRFAVASLLSRRDYDTYVDWQNAAYTNNQIYNLAAFNAVLSWLRVLKYLRLSRRFSMFEQVFFNVRYELMAWALLFLIIFAGFSQGFFLAFRDDIPQYGTVFVSMTTLFQGVYGDLDLHNLQAAASLLGPFFFISYTFIVCFVMMSMFLAILQGAWMKAEEDDQKDGEDDLAAALAFAIANAKDNAKRQGFKLKNLMVRQKEVPKSPRHLASLQQFSVTRDASPPNPQGALKRMQTLPRKVLGSENSPKLNPLPVILKPKIASPDK